MLSASEFLSRWSGSAGSERAHAQPFFLDLCDVLGVDRPPAQGDGIDDYRFEKPITIPHPDGHTSTDRIDFYRKGAFVMEAKQAKADADVPPNLRRGAPGWRGMMERAFAQGRNYAVNLPEGRPPFLMTCDIGHCFEVWTGFGGDYGGYAAGRRIPLDDLARDDVRAYLAAAFTDPFSLDPARRAAKVTREVATYLADLGQSLEATGGRPDVVARFLMRCLFTMFAEDVGLLEDHLFTRTLQDAWIPHPERFPAGIEALWKEMDRGGLWGAYPIRRFNGGLFREVHAIPLDAAQLRQLLQASKCDWSDVEPAIFGTMLERALDVTERHRLGAHFTPREYIERLVRPTVLEPLRAEWDAVRAAARQVAEPETGDPTPADRRRAARMLRDFLQRLCGIKVLDPACGTGNFLYVTFDLLKELEAEVLRELSDLGDVQQGMELEGVRVVPEQFLGIEVNPRARAIADLVLWLGWLQWARRAGVPVTDPVLRDGKNIACRDAVLAHDTLVLRRDADGRPVTVWDMRTTKKHPVTGKDVPDEDAQVPVYDYPNAHPAEWPDADFIVSNPPFVGNKRMREALGDGYTEALRRAWPDVDGSADLVMYWWDKAATLARQGRVRRFGFITTNSITQAFNRKVLERHLKAADPVAIAWAIADHPWVIDGAAVRIAMTVGCRAGDLKDAPVLGEVTCERDPDTATVGSARLVDVVERKVKRIHADLSGGADVAEVTALKANSDLVFRGITLVGEGFRVTAEEVGKSNSIPFRKSSVVRPYLTGRELAHQSQGRYVIDFYGIEAEEARTRYPREFQRLLNHVKPEREQNKRVGYRQLWWIFGEPRPNLRRAAAEMRRIVITPEVAKHRFFVFVDTNVLPDQQLFAICSDDSWVLGVLSSRIHLSWSLHVGGTLEDRPRWSNVRCFDPFPFPDANDAQKARIRELAEHLDAHRKQVQAAHADVTLTGIYNALQRAREGTAGGPALTAKEREFHDRALIGVLRSIHEDLDAAVAQAYGWPVDLPDDEVLARLVSLNAVRAAEEVQGFVRWLRPDFQKARAGIAPVQQGLAGMQAAPAAEPVPSAPQPWPKDRYDQVRAVRDVLASHPGTATAEDIHRAFLGASLPAIRRHLDMLERIGVAVAYDDEPAHTRRFHLGAA